MKPFLKWAGGKTLLLNIIKTELPTNINEYHRFVEPFVGGGAIFLDFLENDMFEEYVVNDVNSKLIGVYKTIKEKPEELIKGLNVIVDEYLKMEPLSLEREKMYYDIREKFNQKGNNELVTSIYFIFLNKTCFNGLYRENSKGYFNVPIGSYKNPKFFDSGQIRNISELLNKKKDNGEDKVILLNTSFEALDNYVDENTFVYFDPPYRPVTKGGFNSYHKSGFNDDKQKELCEFYQKLNNKNAKLMLSNSDPKNLDENDLFFDELYKGFNIQRVLAKRNINSNGADRGAITELLIKNY